MGRTYKHQRSSYSRSAVSEQQWKAEQSFLDSNAHLITPQKPLLPEDRIRRAQAIRARGLGEYANLIRDNAPYRQPIHCKSDLVKHKLPKGRGNGRDNPTRITTHIKFGDKQDETS